MNTKENIEVRLWDYIDGVSSAEERIAIKNLLANNVEWQEAYAELLNMQQMITSSDLEQPSMRFTKNVMDKISDYNASPAVNYLNKKIIWGIGFAFIALIAGFLIYAFAQLNWNASAGGSSYFAFKNLDFSKFFNSTYTSIFLMANTIAGLMLLDRFLAGKKNQANQQA